MDFLGPLSPLTSIPDSSPWPSPFRHKKRKDKRCGKRNRLDLIDGVGVSTPRFIQSAHWHLSEARRNSSGYQALPSLDPNRVVFPKSSSPKERLGMLRTAGYRLVTYENRTTFLTDKGGTCLGCVIPPKLKSGEIEQIGKKLQDLQTVSKHVAKLPRGTFKIVTYGIQMGFGSKIPSPCFQGKAERHAAKDFFENQNVKKHLRNVGDKFRCHFPRLHRYYWSTLGLSSPFVYDGSPPSNEVPFACFTLNVGNQCICGAHSDSRNLSCGLCLASPFGAFDYKNGGHLILHELKLVLEVPPGAAVLFPSAIITHENIPIAENEFRQTITAFTPGSLFRWVDNGFLRCSEIQSRVRRNRKSYYKLIRGKISQPKQANSWDFLTKYLPHVTSMF